jgi:hypothetical protein
MTLSALGIFSAAGAGILRSGVAGYFGGGLGVPGNSAAVDKFTFPSDTRSTLGTGLSSARYGLAGMANSGVAGYFAGGFTTSEITTVDKFAFPADTRTTLGTGLVSSRKYAGGMANSGVAGYIGGGDNSGTRRASVEKFTFPSDTRSTITATFTEATTQLTGCANSGVAGYFVGGDTSTDGGQRRMEKITFPADTMANTNGFLPINQGAARLAGMANSGVAGYVGGGERTAVVATVFTWTFPSDTLSTLGTGLSAARTYLAAMANSGVAGYFGGGGTSVATSNSVSTVDKFEFPSNTRSTLGTGLATANQRLAGMADSGVL